MHTSSFRSVRLLALLAATGSPLAAQQPGWHAELSAGASVFFGASSQQLVTSGASLARADSTLELSGSVQFRYGEAAGEDGDRFVSARAWLASLSVDLIPEARLTPFVFGTAEASLEKRIANRRSGGIGAKRVLARAPSGETSLSLAVLGERTRSLDSTGATQSLARWSARFKTKYDVAERVTVSHTTFYQPAIAALARYTIASTTDLSFRVNDSLALTFTLVDNYDSEARERGALANNDGHLVFGAQASL